MIHNKIKKQNERKEHERHIREVKEEKKTKKHLVFVNIGIEEYMKRIDYYFRNKDQDRIKSDDT